MSEPSSKTPEQLLEEAIASKLIPPSTSEAYKHEKSLWTNGSVREDPFYQLAPETTSKAPGSLLKLEETTDCSKYTLPPGVAMSRLIYQSSDLLGRSLLASAFLLWPYIPRKSLDDGVPLVVWAHAATGLHGEAAPFPLVLNGYAVLAPDFAGLGVDTNGSGQHIMHEFLGHPAQANDVIYGVKAATEAFTQLSKHFVVIGHSQGGGVAWNVAQRQAEHPTAGYLGAVASCPVTNILELSKFENPQIPALAAFSTPAIQHLFPDFRLSDVLTENGIERLQLWERVQGSVSTGVRILISNSELVKKGWQQNKHVQEFVARTSNGGKEISGLLLVIQGEDDANMICSVTEAAVNKTKEKFPSSQIEFVKLPRVGHNHCLFASQALWLDWIARRFCGEDAVRSCDEEVPKPPRSLEAYQMSMNWYSARATEPWHT